MINKLAARRTLLAGGPTPTPASPPIARLLSVSPGTPSTTTSPTCANYGHKDTPGTSCRQLSHHITLVTLHLTELREPRAKSVGNSPRTTGDPYRGALLIHAGKHPDPDGSASLLWTMPDPEAFGQPREAWEARGAIIGLVFLADILTDSPSRWAVPGWYHWVFEFPSPIDPPVLSRGRQRLWTPPADAVEKVADLYP